MKNRRENKMKKLILITAILAGFSGLFAQNAPPATPPPVPNVTTPPPTTPPPTPPPAPAFAELLADPKNKEEIEKLMTAMMQKKEDDKKKSPEQLQLEQFESDKQKLAAEQTEFKKQKNEVTAQSYMLDPKIALDKSLLPYIGITANLDESGVKTKVEGFKAAIDAHIKGLGLVQTGKFIPGGTGGTKETPEEIAARIRGAAPTTTVKPWGTPRT